MAKKFNVAECHSTRLIRHLPDKQIQFDYSLHQRKLEQVQSAKYLGVTVSLINWVNIFQKVKQLRKWVYFGEI